MRPELFDKEITSAKEEIEDCVQNFKDFELGKRAILLGKRIYDVVETKNLFNIKI